MLCLTKIKQIIQPNSLSVSSDGSKNPEWLVIPQTIVLRKKRKSLNLSGIGYSDTERINTDMTDIITD